MSVPEEIRKVKRPTNSIVKQIGNKYAVIERVGCKRINGRNIPQNGHVIGHIVNGEFVPKEKIELEITLKNYGDYRLAYSVSADLIEELSACYDPQTAIQIFAVSLLRAVDPSLKDYHIQDGYEESYISVDYPDMKLGKNKVSALISSIGKDYSKALRFMQNRIEKVDAGNVIAIDGMLKSNNSRINSLSDFSYKSKLKSSREISIVVAFNVTTKEILCSIPYAGNCVDITSFPDFIEKSGIRSGIIIGDKGTNKGDGLNIDGVGYIFPLKRSNRKISEELDIYAFDGKLPNKDTPILCKKVYDSNDKKYYYGFQDIRRAAKEEQDYISSRKFSITALENRKKRFGTVVYISDRDLTCEEVYNLYQERWEIELVNNFYKNILELDTVREHDDYSVYGSEFINLISSIIGNRIKNRFNEEGLFKNYTYKQLMKILRKYKKIKDPKGKDIWYTICIAKKEKEIINKLGI